MSGHLFTNIIYFELTWSKTVQVVHINLWKYSFISNVKFISNWTKSIFPVLFLTVVCPPWTFHCLRCVFFFAVCGPGAVPSFDQLANLLANDQSRRYIIINGVQIWQMLYIAWLHITTKVTFHDMYKWQNLTFPKKCKEWTNGRSEQSLCWGTLKKMPLFAG